MSYDAVTFFVAALIASALQGTLIALNIEGDRSFVYGVTCGVIALADFAVLPPIERRFTNALFLDILVGCLVGAIVGYGTLLLYGKASISLLLDHQPHSEFRIYLVQMWCVFTALFGVTVNSLWWLVRKIASLRAR